MSFICLQAVICLADSGDAGNKLFDGENEIKSADSFGLSGEFQHRMLSVATEDTEDASENKTIEYVFVAGYNGDSGTFPYPPNAVKVAIAINILGSLPTACVFLWVIYKLRKARP